MQKSTPPTDLLTDELRFLIACCQAEPTEMDIDLILSYLSQNDTPQPSRHSGHDPESTQSQSDKHQNLILLANRHGILPLVYKTLRRLSEEGLLRDSRPVPLSSSSTPIGDPQSQGDSPSFRADTTVPPLPLNAFLSDLKSAYSQIAFRNMLMTGDLIKMMDLLRENHIEALAFKGPALAQMAYGDITMRQFGDLDVLIKKEDVYRVDTLLQPEGYERLLVLTPVQEKIWIRYAHDLGLVHREKGTHFEMHWSLMDEDYPMQLDLDAYRDNRQKITINDREIPTFSIEYLLVYLSIHGSKHLWERIEWIKDIDLLIRREEINWEKVIKLSEGTGFERMIYLGLSLGSELFGSPLPADIHAQIQRTPQIDTLSRFVLENWKAPKSTFAKTAAMLRLFPGLKERLLYLHKIILKPSFNEYWFIDLPKGMYWAYYLVRPYLLLKKYLSKEDQRS